MKRLSILALAITLLSTPVFAADQRQNNDLYWSGVLLAGVGGGVLGWGIGSPAQGVVCVGGVRVTTCQETGVNKMAWIGMGGAITVAGVVMAAIGGKKVPKLAKNIDVAPLAHGLKVLKTITF